MKKHTLYTLTLCLFLVSCSSKFRQKKADRLYDSFHYVKAKDLYLDLVRNGDSSSYNIHKLALVYTKLRDFSESEKWFSRYVHFDSTKSIDIYDYAMLLRSKEKYDESNRWMEKFYNKNTTDSRAINFDKNLVNKIKKEGDKFIVNCLESNSEYSDFGPVYYGDKLTFVSSRNPKTSIKRRYSWDGKPFLNIFSSDITSQNKLSNINKIEGSANTKFHDGPVSFSKDLKTVYFTRNNYENHKSKYSSDKINKLKIFKASVSNDNKFINEVSMPFNNDEYSVAHPSLSSDGKWLYFSSDMPGGYGGADIYKVEVKDHNIYGKPINLGSKINTEGNEFFPYIHNSGKLFFSSDGLTGLGGLDIFVTFFDENGSVRNVKNVGMPLNSSYDDFSLVLNPDEVKGYFSSNREGCKADDDIYSFEVLEPFDDLLVLKGEVKDKRTNEIIPFTKILLKDEDNKIISEYKTNKTGSYKFDISPNANYYIETNKEKYEPTKQKVSSIDIGDKKEIVSNVFLERKSNISLLGVITDGKTNETIDSVNVVLHDNLTDSVYEFKTLSDGQFVLPLNHIKLNDRGSYNISLSRNGYNTKKITYNKTFDKPGVYKIHSDLDLSLEKFEVGLDLAKIIDIKPIYFDLNKYNIRPDAAIELNKIVKVMNENSSMEIELGSHTDSRGSSESNQILSEKRAKSSARYIAERINNPSRIYGKGYGESIPNTIDLSKESKSSKFPLKESYINSFRKKNRKEFERLHQLNRRTEFIIKKM